MSTTIEEGLVAYLLAAAPITALVGVGANARIFPLRMPDNPAAWPVLVYHKISGPRDSAHSGPTGFARARFQFSCWSDDYAKAKRLAMAVVQAFEGYHGAMGAVQGVASDVDNELDLFDPPSRLFHTAVDVMIDHQEPLS